MIERMVVTTERGEYRWDGGTYTETPDGVSLVFEDFIPDAEETPQNVIELIEHYEEAKELEERCP